MALFRRVKPPFGLKTLQKDSNCIAIQDPSAVWGVQDFLPRRNLLTYSEDFSNAAWYKDSLLAFGSGSTANAETAPDGTLTADKIVAAAGTNTQVRVSYSPNITSASTYIFSVYVKAGGFTWARILVAGGPFTTTYCYVNLTTGEKGASGNPASATVSNIDGQWWRISLNTGLTTTGSSGNVFIQIASGDNNSSVTGDGASGVYVWGAQLTRADTLDQSYQKITDWTTEQYAWAAARQVPWLRRNRFINTATLSTQTVSSVTASPITVSFKGTGTITFSTAYSGSLVGTGANDRVTATFTPAAGNLVCTVSGTVTEAQCENGSAATNYQPILADWDATYTAAAIAAGYPISLWQDSAGTKAVNSDNQAIGKMLDMKGTYTATQATTANQPKWRLDANGKPYIERDLTNDSLPITLPTVLSDAQLGPELATGIDLTGAGWSSLGTVSNITSNSFTTSGGGGRNNQSLLSPGKYYRVTVTFSKSTAASFSFRLEQSGADVASSTALSGTLSAVGSTGSSDELYFRLSASDTVTLSNISVREVTGTNVVYTAEGNVTLKDSGLILSGSYAPITPAVDYGRIIMAADSRYDAKIVKYLDGKRGRVYSLGPELIPTNNLNGFIDALNCSHTDSIITLTATIGGITKDILTAGKTYVVVTRGLSTPTSVEFSMNTADASVTPYNRSNTFVGFGSYVFVATYRYIYLRLSGASTNTSTVSYISVREVLL